MVKQGEGEMTPVRFFCHFHTKTTQNRKVGNMNALLYFTLCYILATKTLVIPPNTSLIDDF